MRDFARLQTSILLRRFAFQVNRTAKSAEVESIHDLRVSIRRLSRCLRTFSDFYPTDSWRRMRKRLAVLMNSAAAVRDQDIALELLQDAGVSPGGPLAIRLGEDRRHAAQELARELKRWKARNFSRKWRARLEL
jgi:CHAD domain-containing protein